MTVAQRCHGMDRRSRPGILPLANNHSNESNIQKMMRNMLYAACMACLQCCPLQARDDYCEAVRFSFLFRGRVPTSSREPSPEPGSVGAADRVDKRSAAQATSAPSLQPKRRRRLYAAAGPIT